jgi:hypothetical protein
VKGLHDRQLGRRGGLQRRQPAHPEVRMHQVRLLPLQALGKLDAELIHVGQHGVLADHSRGAGAEMLDPYSGQQRHAHRQGRIIPAGVDHHLVAAPRERLRQCRDMHVLATRIDPAETGQRARVF